MVSRLSPFILNVAERLPLVGSALRKRKLYLHYSRFVPLGHFYSPVLSDLEIDDWIRRTRSAVSEGVDRRLAEQERLVEELSRHYRDLPFQENRVDALRYYHGNSFFTYADAILLSLLLRHLQPARIVEVGSGFSSAVMLDTVEHFLRRRSEITFIEPHPNRLKALLKPDDSANCSIIETPVQEVSLDVFTSLGSNDVLFIDSSHVSKAGSDVNFLMFEVLPKLRSGVWVHIHDIGRSFDYPPEAMRKGVGWNEAYLVHAFLLFNDAFEVTLHNPYIIGERHGWFSTHMPDCLRDPGSSLWLRRK